MATAIVLAVFLLVAQHQKAYALRDYADFTVWRQVIASIAQGHVPSSTLEVGLSGGTSAYFGVHFAPVVYLFSIPYALWPSVECILWLQWLLLMATCVPLYSFAKRQLGKAEYGLFAVACLVLYPPFEYIHLYEIEMLRFSIPLLLTALVASESGWRYRYWLAIAGALLVREEVSLTVFVLGLYILLVRKRRLQGAITSVAALGYFLVVTQIVMQQLRPGQGHVAAGSFSELGGTMLGVALAVFTKPMLVLRQVLVPVKLANLFMYVMPLLLVPFAAWPLLLIASANVGLNLLSSSETYTSYFLYYLSPTIPVIFVALIEGIKIMGRKLDTWKASVRLASLPSCGTRAIVLGVFSAVLSANVFFGPSPLSIQFWVGSYRLAPFRTERFHYSQYIVTRHDRVWEEFVSVVPKSSIVSAEQHLLPPLFDRRGLRVFPDIAGADFVVIDKPFPLKTGIPSVPGSWDGLRKNPQYYYDWVEKEPSKWYLVAQRDGYFAYARTRSDPSSGTRRP